MQSKERSGRSNSKWVKSEVATVRDSLKVEGSVRFLDGVKNCTDSVHKFSRAFLLCYEFVQFLTPSKNLTDPSTFTYSAFYALYAHFAFYPDQL
jgi:hypothetical protein